MKKHKITNNIDKNKRDFIKKAAYTAPAIITMAAIPSFASAGSGWQPDEERTHRNHDRN